MEKLKRKQRNKEWREARARKLIRLKHRNKYKRHIHSSYVSEKRRICENKRAGDTYTLRVPEVFSLFSGTNQTVAFFEEVINMFSVCQPQKIVFFDFSGVQVITVDAVMYFIALMKNTRRVYNACIECRGNLPQEKEARKVIEEVGFYDYLFPVGNTGNIDNRKYVRISHGDDADGELAGSICDFVNNALDKDLTHTKRLYPMIVELMTNTHQHAYDKNKSFMNCHWYIFAQELDSEVQFVFLDTGLGIPRTVYKHFTERAKSLLLSRDEQFLASVLKGDFRTETQQKYRGKGLPGIYEDVCNHSLTDFSVISGKGQCNVKSDGTIEKIALQRNFIGTLFKWTIGK